MYNNSRFNNYLRAIVPIFVSLIGISILFEADFPSQLRTLNWSKEIGQIVTIWCAKIKAHQSGCTTNAHYKYSYNGIEYESNLVGFGQASDDFYSSSDSVVVYVNPNNPQESVLKKINYESLAFCLIFIGMGICFFFFSREVEKIRDLT